MKKGELWRDYIYVEDPDTGNPVIGLVNGDFGHTIIVNGTVSAETLTLTEVDAVNAKGEYKIEHTPVASGDRQLIIEYTPLELRWSGTYDVADVDIDDISDQIETLQQGSGSETATIYAKETSTENPIPEAYFEIWDESDTTRLHRDEDSDANGTAVFNLAPGSYKVRIRKPFWDFPTSSDLTVPSGGTSLTIHATHFSPSAPSGPDLCVVYGFLIDTQNNKVSGATISARLDNDEAFSESQKIADMVIETTSDSEGYFELALIPNSKLSIEDTKYEFTVLKASENYQWRKRGAVPDQDNANIEDVVNPAPEE